MSKRDFLNLRDLTREELVSLLQRAAEWRTRRESEAPRPLQGATVALVFDKASTRKRVSFEVAITELGGQPMFLSARDTQLGRGEPLEDTARVLSGYVHGLVVRTFGHEIVERLARASTIPIVNALTDLSHPCQVLADLQTMVSRRAGGSVERLSELRLAWIGDGNNVCNSWIEAAGMLGLELAVASPEGFDPDPAFVDFARMSGARLRLLRDADEAMDGADVVSTDVWASMGQEADAEARRRAFAGYQVSAARWKRTRAGAIFLHCLPAHRGEEVAPEIIDGPMSAIIEQAHDRLHAQKALLEVLYG